MRRLLSLFLSLILLLSACAPAEGQQRSAYFPDGEILEDIGSGYDELNARRSLEENIDREHPYTHQEPLPDRYQFALSTPHTACGIDFTPIYSFMFKDEPPNGFVQVMYLHHHSVEPGDAAKYQEILQALSEDFSNSYGALRPMYGFEDTLSEFLKKPIDEQIKALEEGNERFSLNSYWTVKESVTKNPRTDLIAKISFMSTNVMDNTGSNPVKTDDKQYGIWVYYTVEEVPDWLEDWMENPDSK